MREIIFIFKLDRKIIYIKPNLKLSILLINAIFQVKKRNQIEEKEKRKRTKNKNKY